MKKEVTTGKRRKAAATKEISLYEINKTIKKKFKNATLIYPDATKSDTLTVTTNSYLPLYILGWMQADRHPLTKEIMPRTYRIKRFESWGELAEYIAKMEMGGELGAYDLELCIRKPNSCRGIPVAKLNI